MKQINTQTNKQTNKQTKHSKANIRRFDLFRT